MSKKMTILVSVGIALLLLLFIYLIYLQNTSKPAEKGSALPTPTPVVVIPEPTLSAEMRTEKIAEEKYAIERKTALDEKPWLLKLPIRSDNYLVTYDTEKNEFIISLYVYIHSDSSSEDQIIKAKQDSSNALRELGLDPTRQRIVYMETTR